MYENNYFNFVLHSKVKIEIHIFIFQSNLKELNSINFFFMNPTYKAFTIIHFQYMMLNFYHINVS